MSEKESGRFFEEFKKLFNVLRRPKQRFAVHPSTEVLKRYMQGTLNDQWSRPVTNLTPWMQEDAQPVWTLSAVSLHVARCEQCSGIVAAWRQPEKKSSWFEEHITAFGWAGQRVRLWTYAYAVVALLFLTFNTTLQMPIATPPWFQSVPGSERHIRPVDLEELDQQMINGYSLFSYFQEQDAKVKSRLEQFKML